MEGSECSLDTGTRAFLAAGGLGFGAPRLLPDSGRLIDERVSERGITLTVLSAWYSDPHLMIRLLKTE
ncbi:MAG: hypothetical protein A2808_00095 [Candidatus Moranbacteria bacterium RIFCSPHIGHO2_01_FULL_55_24]|nr:MAG: hypothetical protein A2808_00095 [Candidatus Moranbacteria bacterium RIFCSPHIGHO2_01_FULL_55_24]